MSYRIPFAPNEWYHCYNRGVDKRKTFQTKNDYERFLTLMYIGNSSNSIHLSNLPSTKLYDVLSSNTLDRGEPLVEIGTYSLMPNHFHFLLKEIREGGIPVFMQKVFTGYTMYFNKKNQRTGALVAGPFKSKHIPDDRYIKKLISYIHLNPIELFEPEWKEGVGNLSKIEEYLLSFPYSGLQEFLGLERLENKIVGNSLPLLFDSKPTTLEILEDAKEYYEEFIKARP